jgi:putative peptide-modifying radical SAM enzyme
MHYHIILTEKCDSRCKYCYEKSMKEFDNGLDKKWHYDLEVPIESEVKSDKVVDFLKDDDVLIFYGGEPLIKFDQIKEIINKVEKSKKKVRFCIQTNGKLLGSVDFDYINKLDKMLVSIDGLRNRTDYNRGEGNYNLIIKNLSDLREKGYKGEIVARMVISPEFRDFYEQLEHLVFLIEKGLIDSVHWQIDAGFYKFDFDERDFKEFVKKYNKDIDDMIEFWINYMKEKKKVLKLYPFLGIFNRVVGWDEETRLQCGAGFANFTIGTNGKLSACPIMNGIKDFYCGSIEDGITNEISIGGSCVNCDYLNVCGGRCLYSNKAELWPKEGFDLTCKTIMHLIDKLKERKQEILDLIDDKIISKKDFEFEKYFGPEIVP